MLHTKSNVFFGRCASPIFLSGFLSCSRGPFGVALLIVMILLGGCGQQDEIRRYQAPRLVELDLGSQDVGSQTPAPHSPLDKQSPQRMLGAIVPIEGFAWFFRINGAPERLQPHVEPFKQWLSTIRFEDDKPSWKLPEGWKMLPPSGMRFATILPEPSDERLELTVIPLPIDGDAEPAILANINRWRDQVGLAAIDRERLAETSESIAAGDLTVTFVDLVRDSAATAEPDRTADRTSADPPLERMEGPKGSRVDLQVPEGWEPASLVTSRGGITIRHEAAFEVTRDGQRLEFTLDRLPLGGSLLMNVNRWRGQIGLEPIKEDVMQEMVSSVKLEEADGEFVELIGDQESILGVIVAHAGEAWYFKLRGDKELAEEEKENFLALARSTKFL